MALCTLKEILADAQKNRYAVPAFDVGGYEMVKSVLEGCLEARSPAIFMALKQDLEGNGLGLLSSMVLYAAEKFDLPVCLHLDHAGSLGEIRRAVEAGFSSVMIDGSELPFEENLRLTKEAAEYAHSRGVSIEAELGHVTNAILGSTGKMEAAANEHDIESCLTDPAEVAEFVAATGVDCLAVAIGTAHGVYIKQPELNIARLLQIRAACPVPLVLHGGSGTPEAALKEAIRGGICKINIYSDLVTAMNSGLKEQLDETENMALWPVPLHEKAVERMKQIVITKARQYGSANRI